MDLLCPWQHSREGTSVWAHKFPLLGSSPSMFRPFHLQEVKGSSIQALSIYSLLYVLTWLSIKATRLRLGLKWAGNFGVTSACHPSPNLCYFFDFQNWHSQPFSTQTISRISLTVSMASQQVVFLSCCPSFYVLAILFLIIFPDDGQSWLPSHHFVLYDLCGVVECLFQNFL